MTQRLILAWIGIVLSWAGYLQASAPEQSSTAPQPISPYKAVLNRYCITCHNEKLKTAGLMLDKLDLENVSEGAPLWEKVIRKLRTGAMPPAGAPRPDGTTYDAIASYLETALDSAAAARPNPGKPVMHRLNRAEYTNGIRDLLAVDTDGRVLLPADDAAYGFDNIGDLLSLSPALLERYISAAEKISRLAIGGSVLPGFETYDISSFYRQKERMSEDLPFGSRGGIAIRHYFPLDGEYSIQVRLSKNALGEIFNIDEPKQVEISLDGTRLQLFAVGDEQKGKSDNEYRMKADAGLEVRFPAKAGMRLVGVAFLKDTFIPESALFDRSGGVRQEELAEGVGSVIVGGPYNAKGPGDTPSRRKIFVCHPANSKDEDLCARKILSNLARNAYRRPVTERDVRSLFSLYETGRSKGNFEAGIGMALEGILVSPGFLFRVERDPANVAADSAYRISDVELASRLSFFLWSSIPDEQLLQLAEQGRLRDPAVLEQQVRRMLADARSKALVDNFAGQWLYLRNMRTKIPDPSLFPDFDANLREAFQRETELFFESILREDRSVTDLLGADYTFLNGRLAQHYGIPNVYGTHFRRVKLSDENRRGLLGQASILTVTSYGTRTAPTLRGKWILENILGTPPPPPPPGYSLLER